MRADIVETFMDGRDAEPVISIFQLGEKARAFAIGGKYVLQRRCLAGGGLLRDRTNARGRLLPNCPHFQGNLAQNGL